MNFFLINIILSVFLFGDSYDETISVANTLSNKMEKNKISNLKFEILKDKELALCKYNFLANARALKYKNDSSTIEKLKSKMSDCREEIAEYRQHILYYKHLTKNINYQNADKINFSNEKLNRMLNGELSPRVHSLSTIKYNLDRNDLVKSILNANNNQVAIDNILNSFFLKYKPYIKNEHKKSYYRDKKNNVTIIDDVSIKNSIIIE
jgi:hypothetical protein